MQGGDPVLQGKSSDMDRRKQKGRTAHGNTWFFSCYSAAEDEGISVPGFQTFSARGTDFLV
jgi:hypothetical protein